MPESNPDTRHAPAPSVKRWARWVELAQQEVNATLAELPEPLQAAARKLPVSYQAVPDSRLRRDRVEPDTLGLFVGAPLAEAQGAHGEVSAHIILFLENLWFEVDADEEFFREEVRTTYLHELGHYLGLNEDDLEERGLM